MRAVVDKAKLPIGASMYALRHTHISHAIVAGMPLTLIATNCGTSVRMIEQHYAHIIASTRQKLIEAHSFKLGAALPDNNVEPLRAKR
jgi:hypothetical protein